MMTPKRIAREISARLTGPHAPEHTGGAAEVAAEVIRYLNYATGSGAAEALAYPSTVYMVAADLSLAASRMPQLFTQLGGWLVTEEDAGRLGTDDGSPVSATVNAACAELAAARIAAERLAARLSALQNTIAGLNGRGPSRAGRAA